MDFRERYNKLNLAQKQAVDTIDGPVMVIAGPGTGKTELLGVRTANILQKTDSLPENILCLTFTDSGADAMRRRLVEIIGKDGYKVAVHTFHSFGTEVINQHRQYFYNGATFQAADDIATYQILRAAFDELDHKNPLGSQKNGEYVHQPDARAVISELKRNSLTSAELVQILDDNIAALDSIEPLIVPLLSDRVSAKLAAPLAAALEKLRQTSVPAVSTLVPPLYQVIIDSLAQMIEQTVSVHPTKPISAWKAKWLRKNDHDQYEFKARGDQAKLRSVSVIYDSYLRGLDQAGLYDYDDMILQLVHAVAVNDDLRFNLQETYHYIMVDEFQDTNLAQMRILGSLTDNPVNEGRPNLLIVGDDDQAIYSFQGADISNILSFQQTFPAAQLITLTDNYRSTSDILGTARRVITQGADRLESVIEVLDKQLQTQTNDRGIVTLRQADTQVDERWWLAQDIAQQIKQGTAPEDIAVITRKHTDIQALLPYLLKEGLVVNYERQDNVLDSEPIVALESLARLVVAISHGQHDTVDGLLPSVLAHPTWNISPHDLYSLSLSAYDKRRHWLDVMQTLPTFADIHSLLVTLGAQANTTALEPMLDLVMGYRHDDDQPDGPRSPLFDYYFSADKRVQDPAAYLGYLRALRTLRQTLRRYKPNEQLTLAAMIECIDLYRRTGSRITTSQIAITTAGAINVMTAHKSKGQEFDTVYVVGATDNVWGAKARSFSRLISYPANLPLAPAGDSLDERLRLFYVALTRAKRHLYISYSLSDDNGKAQLAASFLAEPDHTPTPITTADSAAQQVAKAELDWQQAFHAPTGDLADLLQPVVARYKLSPTHLCAFLDVARGGPQSFFLNNLLHFPSSKSASAMYGSAIHKTLQQAHQFLAAQQQKKPIEDVLKDFQTNLQAQRLDPQEYEGWLQKGSDDLGAYLAATYDDFTPTQLAELSFASQQSMLDQAHLTGSLDVADIDKKAKQMIVTDYKTGRPARSWTGGSDYQKIKLYHYRQQLLFYKILVEQSRDYGTYTVTTGRLAFIEPTKSGEIVHLDLDFSKEELDRTRQLIAAVWQHVTTLTFPDTSDYDQSLKGILAFEQDLIDNHI